MDRWSFVWEAESFSITPFSYMSFLCIARMRGPPRGYEEQGNLPFFLMKTWEHEQIL